MACIEAANKKRKMEQPMTMTWMQHPDAVQAFIVGLLSLLSLLMTGLVGVVIMWSKWVSDNFKTAADQHEKHDGRIVAVETKVSRLEGAHDTNHPIFGAHL